MKQNKENILSLNIGVCLRDLFCLVISAPNKPQPAAWFIFALFHSPNSSCKFLNLDTGKDMEYLLPAPQSMSQNAF